MHQEGGGGRKTWTGRRTKGGRKIHAFSVYAFLLFSSLKDLHRTGCSSYCGQEAEQDRVVLKRVLLAYARWNKSVGYCQGFNILAALILEVMEGNEGDALKVSRIFCCSGEECVCLMNVRINECANAVDSQKEENSEGSTDLYL